MRYRRKTKQNRKNGVYFHAKNNGMCTGKKTDQKAYIHTKYTELENIKIHSIFFWISEMLLKSIIVYFFV